MQDSERRGEPSSSNVSSSSSSSSSRHVCIPVVEESTNKLVSNNTDGAGDDFLDTDTASCFSTFDDKLLHRAVRDACRWAYGTVFVEVWALSDDHTCLFRPEAGWWIDPVYHRTVACTCQRPCELCRLTDARRPDGVAPTPLAPGEGLPGFLWSELANSSQRPASTRTAAVQSAASLPLGFGSFTRKNSIANSFTAPRVIPKHVTWRSIDSIANDPDQPWSPRLQSIGASGLGWVGAVPFHAGSSSGIVMYMARPTVDWDRLTHPINDTYLLAAAHLAGSAYALRGPRHQVQQERKSETQHTLSVVRAKIMLLKGAGLKERVDGNDSPTESTTVPSRPYKSALTQHGTAFSIRKHLKTVMVKMMGGGGRGPPAMGWMGSFHVLAGVFLSLLSLSGLNLHVRATYGEEYAIVLGYVAEVLLVVH